MGNSCLKLRSRRDQSSTSSKVWEDDDHDMEDSFITTKNLVVEKQNSVDDGHFRSASNGREIKIKITKKQLEKLLGEVDVHEIPVDQVLQRLINASSECQHCNHIQNQRSWRPCLQSIPEVD